MIDARGLACPLPVIQVQRAIEKSHPDTLEVLTQESDDADALLQGGEDALIDPFGTQIKYEKRGRKRPLLTSAGPDGDFGTEDDITNIDTKKK